MEAAAEAPGGLRGLMSGPSRISHGGHDPEGIQMQLESYLTDGGIRVRREIVNRPYSPADTALADALDTRRGVLFSSSFEFPGRYTRWDMGFIDPPLVFSARDRAFTVEALNARGKVLIGTIAESLQNLDAVAIETTGTDRIDGKISIAATRFPEE